MKCQGCGSETDRRGRPLEALRHVHLLPPVGELCYELCENCQEKVHNYIVDELPKYKVQGALTP